MCITSMYFRKAEVAHNSINYMCSRELECGAGSTPLHGIPRKYQAEKFSTQNTWAFVSP